MGHLLQSLPPKPRSALVRAAATTLLVSASFLVLLGLHQPHGLLGFYLLFPAIFVVSVLFDRSSGIYASILSSTMLYVMLTPVGSIRLPTEFILPLLLFLVISVSFAIISEGLRTAWERAAAAERSKDLLLRESVHRTKNIMTMVFSILSLQARSKVNSEACFALENAVTRVQAIASAHEQLQLVENSERVEMRAYLQRLCAHLGDAFRGLRPIAVKVVSPELYLPPEQAIPLGLIVNELVTNSLKHAFRDDQDGTIDVMLSKNSAFMLVVRDNGVGCPDVRPGTGSRLTRLLAQQLGARIEWQSREGGCEVRLVFS